MKTANAALTALINGQRKGLSFNGTDRHVDLPTATVNALLDGTAWSVEFWLRTGSSGSFTILGDRGTQRQRQIGYNTWTSSNSLGFAEENVVAIGASGIIPLGRPTFCGLTYGGGVLQFYLQGVASGSPASWTATGNATGQECIGDRNPLGVSGYLDGIVDNFRIYGRQLTAVEMLEHFNGVYRNEALSGLWLPFDEGSGTVAYDLSGNANNGTLVNTPPYVDFDPYPDQRNTYWVAELFTITLIGGGILRFTTADTDIVSGGLTFSSTGPLIQRGKIRNTVGVEVDTLGLTVVPKSTDLVNGQAWMPAVLNGALDGADVKVEKAYMPTWGNTAAGTLIMFAGRVAEVRPSRSFMDIDVKSHLELLNIQMPRNLWQPGCVHTTFDAGCTLVKASFKSSTTVGGGSTTTVLNCGLAQAAGYFDLGTITFTSGPNSGISRTVKSYTPGVITLLSALPNVPGTGNGFDAYPGDDKTQATCTNKFANLANFKATPYIPVAETAV